YIRVKMKGKSPYDPNDINYLAVGRLTYQKGFDILLDAFKLVLDQIPNAKLTILGEGELKDSLILQAKNLGILNRVDFHGFVDNPYPYYYYSDTFVLSSRF